MRFKIALVLFAALLALAACGSEAPDKAAGPGAVVLLGDSITSRGDWERLLPGQGARNLGLDGDRTAGMLARLPAALDSQPRLLCLMGGINDIFTGLSVDQAYDNLRRVADQARRAGVQVLLQSTLPVGAEMGAARRINAQVAELNQRLAALAAQEGLGWLDLRPVLTRDGFLPPNLHVGDGVHLNARAYRLWAGQLGPWLSRTGR